MIAKIIKANDYAALVNYHIKKVKEGDAKLLFDGTFSYDFNFVNTFDDHFSRFDKENMKNKVAHISISFPHGEDLIDDKILEISEEYLEKMGYGNCFYLIFRHYDKNHEHIHIISATLDYDGKKVKEYEDFTRSVDISRELEKRYNLKETKYNQEHEKSSLNEINFRKYYMHRAIKKASQGYNTKEFINNFLTKVEKERIFVKSELSQKDIKRILKEDRFNNLYNYLNKNGHFKALYKDEISFKLDLILKNVNTMKDFTSECKKNNIYARLVYGKDNKPAFVYGLVDHNVYFKETNFSSRFRFSNFFAGLRYNEKGRLNLSQAEQFNNTKNGIIYSFNKANTYQTFSELLNQRGIEIVLSENKNGPYNISFRNTAATTPVLFGSEELGINFKDIRTKFGSENIVSNIQTEIYDSFLYEKNLKPAVTPHISIAASKRNNHPQEDEDIDLSGKKKKKGLGF